MSYQISCRDAQDHLKQVKALEQELNRYLEHAQNPTTPADVATENIQKAREIRKNLDREVIFLNENANLFEQLINLREQYESQMNVLETAKILEEREINGEKVKGIVDIEGNFHQVPTHYEVVERLREQKELIKKKCTQGFGLLRLVPFGIPLSVLKESYARLLKEYYVESAYRTPDRDKTKVWGYTKNRRKRERVPLVINKLFPITDFIQIEDGDKRGSIVYHPKQFKKQNHAGQTKGEILYQRRYEQKNAWDVLLLENQLTIPQKGFANDINGRRQVATEHDPNQYLHQLQTNPMYQGEVGITLEDWLIHAITQLINKNEVIDNVEGDGSASYNLGTYYPSPHDDFLPEGVVSVAYFNRHADAIHLLRDEPHADDRATGTRFGLRF